jgi:anti-sigma factor RsiW
MIHWSARRRLPDLLEDDLAPGVEARVRGHVQGCARCRRLLRELQRSEALLRELPASLVPALADAGTEARLAALARWAAEPEPVWRERFGASAIGAFAVAACLVWVFLAGSWAPVVYDPSRSVALAAVMPEAQISPPGWR